MVLGKALNAVRLVNKLSQETLAETVDITVGYLSAIENNNRTPSLAVLEDLCTALKIPVWQLLFLVEFPEQHVDFTPKEMIIYSPETQVILDLYPELSRYINQSKSLVQRLPTVVKYAQYIMPLGV